MNKEFKRMVELAGLTEIKVINPIHTLIGPDYSKESAKPMWMEDSDKIVVMKGNKKQILDYMVNNVAPLIGYKILNNGAIGDVDEDEEEIYFSNLEKFKEYIWEQLTSEGFGFIDEEFTVKEQ